MNAELVLFQLNHMHVHGLAGKRKWIDNYGKIMWATIKMEPNLYKELALPGEQFDGFGAAVELRDLESALRADVKIRVNETIMDRARNVLRVMEYLMKDNVHLKNQPLSKEAREQAEIAAEKAYQTAKASVLRHLREGHGTSGSPAASPSTSRKTSLSGGQASESSSGSAPSRRSSRSNASSSQSSLRLRKSSFSSLSAGTS
jgi:hypothetical protein